MKKPILIIFIILFIGLGLFIFLQGNVGDGKTGNFINFKTAIKGVLVKWGVLNSKDETTSKTKSADALLLLLPDNSTNNSNFVRAWQNVALEEGLHLDLMSDSEFLNLPKHEYKGIILPDTLHKSISPNLLKKIMGFVSSGGSLMLVYDAGIQNVNNLFADRQSLMSSLLGLSCTRSDDLKGCISEESPIGNSINALTSLGIPPGKCIIDENKLEGEPNSAEPFCEISSIEYGVLTYPHYVINPINNIPLLLTTKNNRLIATVQSFGKGRVLFINLPITSLWADTDAMFLHVFLNYFASTLLKSPKLAAVPNGIGGIIMNLHVESIDALSGFSFLQKIGLFTQGPYSIDFTAGPGLDDFNDHQGLDVLNNHATQGWIKTLAKLGHAIGADGGWLHNYYALHASEKNQAEFEKYLKMNFEAVEKVLGHKIYEYVPPNGNQPSWATRYLERHGFLGYYSTSNTGSAPTQNFNNGVFDQDQLWSFPVLPFGKDACFRDFGRDKSPVQVITDWLIQSSTFVSSEHTSRLIYFHPTDILFFPQYLTSIKNWLNFTQQLHNEKRFQWYTMVDLARFLNSRRKVNWTVENKGDFQFFTASHPVSLASQTWLLNKAVCNKPVLLQGRAAIKEDETYWLVQAGDVKHLEFNCQRIPTEKKM